MTSDHFESALGKFRSDLAAEGLRQAIRNLETKFDHNPPRAPEGSADGGQWVDTGRGGGGKVRRPEKATPKLKVRRLMQAPVCWPATLKPRQSSRRSGFAFLREAPP